MNETSPAKPEPKPDAVPLNPALKQMHDASYGPDQQGSDPMNSVSVQKEEGAAWPMIWAVTTAVCVLVTVLLLIL